MKDEGINLVAGRRAEQKVEHFISGPSLIIFGVVFVIATVLVIYSFLLSSQYDSLVSQETSVRAQISTVSAKRDKITIIHERLAAIRSIIAKRSSLSATVFNILSIIPDDFSLDGITADDNQVSITVTSNSLAEFADFLEQKIPSFAAKDKTGVKTVQVRAFSQSKNGYSLGLDFLMNGGTAK
ncbi:MAG TPA: hypothetical protein VG965_01975 [Patescibacteria group bacterium]|nr:hypothetical protein [Patescibacteria group bacterium]